MQDLNDKITGDTLTAAEFVQPMSELQNVIEATGQTLSSGDLNQLGKGIAEYAASGAFYTDSGAADAYVLTAVGGKQAPAAYADGQTFTFVTANPNTGASTANPAGLGVKYIKLADGTDPNAGAVNGRTTLSYDLGNDWLEVPGGAAAVQVFTANGTYTPAAGVKSIKITSTGGGGGGGGISAGSAGQSAAAGAGAGGGTAILTTDTIDASYTITLGLGGARAAAGNNSGSPGGNTTVTSTSISMTGNGGGGGGGSAPSASYSLGGGSIGGAASGGDLAISGGDSGESARSGEQIFSFSRPGGSFWGPGVRAQTGGAAQNGDNYGTGGQSPSSIGVATAFDGGDGADGIVVIEEFF